MHKTFLCEPMVQKPGWAGSLLPIVKIWISGLFKIKKSVTMEKVDSVTRKLILIVSN